jgi:hypothetical protein
VRDTVRDDARLARACAGKNQQRTISVTDGALLLGVERGKKIDSSILQ